jgi:hypothetical protein
MILLSNAPLAKFAPEHLEAFQITYVPLASLAKELGTTSRGLMSALRDANIEVLGALTEGSTNRAHLRRRVQLTSYEAWKNHLFSTSSVQFNPRAYVICRIAQSVSRRP